MNIETPTHFSNLDSDFFRNVAPNLSVGEVEEIVIALQNKILKERVSGKYDAILLAVDYLSNFNPLYRDSRGKGVFPALEVAYHFGRILDDIADEDAQLPAGFNNFNDLTFHLRGVVTSGREPDFSGGVAEFLLVRSMERLKAVSTDGREVESENLNFLDAMLFEHNRRINRAVNTSEELEEIYQHSFSHPQNIALIAIGSETRSSDIPELAQVQGSTYALDDLKPELARGICNVPKEVLIGAGIDLEQLMQDPNLVDKSEVLQTWIKEEEEKCGKLLEVLDRRRLAPRDWVFVKFMTFGARRRVSTGEGFRMPETLR